MSRAYLAFTAKGEALAQRLAEALPGSVSRCGGDVTLKGWTAEHFAQDEALIFVGAVGIAVRAIAPHCRSKAADPAVVVVDEGGNFAVPLLSGHLGGANALARALAKACGAVPVITTATDVNGLFAVDLWAKAQNCAVLEPERIKRVSGALLAGQTVRYWAIVILKTSCMEDQKQDEATLKSKAVLENISERKSVRKYLSKSVEEDKIDAMLKAGMAAPSGMDRRPWEFVVVTDRVALDSMAMCN